MTPIADMVETMLARGVSHDVIVLAIRTAEWPITLPVTRSRKAANQAAYRGRIKQKQQDGVALAASPVAVTPDNAVTGHVTGVPTILTSLLPSVASLGKKKRSSEPRARGTRLPDDWQPSDADREYATGLGLAPAIIEVEATKFRNYWTNRTDRQASKPRWDRAWQNWILNVRKPNGNERSVVAAQDRLNAKLAEFSEPDLLGGVRREAGSADVRLLPTRRSG